ncbi:M15 family metallopeptidase [Tenuibacillus multivorans]|uniref:D-alanyl-D-alanine carboxypeptidase n=1 Tax=Tenuibacillus multivorans TaxID=237069 RepID=A0A1H0EXU7_9BACI|nr:M15 family metallopeptidase [Tenuibacillus multivorans]GEL78846.1 D-alanyl-D-alanine carboxypeptidase [Tenuibacillus multivorans]SDN87224.1 D-alanyl-D-alanine carboxypeptidase [Tenuibacillus multivorans]
MKRLIIIASSVLIMTGCNQDTAETLKSDFLTQADLVVEGKETLQTNQLEDNETDMNEEEQENNPTDESSERNEPEDNAIIVEDPHALDVVVNKVRRLPKGFVPKNLVEPQVPFNASEGNPKRLLREEAANALEELFAAAKEEGFDLVAQSGYRSIERQIELYNWYVENYGQDWVDQYSAVPGHSEHHTGLTMDITSDVVAMELVEAFGETEPGQWVEEHAHEYGFVIRYPKGKSDITGYSYEPWHLRYFGVETATDIYESGVTVEEYYGFVE